jgi:hypothetical protein
MKPTSGGSSRAGAWLLALVGMVTLALVAGVVYYWMVGAGLAEAPAALAPPTTTAPRAGAPVPKRDPKATADELVALAPEITPAAAVLLVREVPNAVGPGLADFGLLIATRGFAHMERADLDEMSALIEQSYATLPPADHKWMGDYMRMLRDGSLSPADGDRGRRLLTQAVRALPDGPRERLRSLMEAAIRAGLEARRQAEARGQQALLAATPVTPAPVVAARSTPESGEPGPATPRPPRGLPSQGKGEAYWRARMAAARGQVTQLKAEIGALDKEAARFVYGPGPEPSCSSIANTPAEAAAQQSCLKTKQNWQLTWQAQQKDRLDRLARKRDELAEAERAIGDVEDEARRDGALPGWLRE